MTSSYWDMHMLLTEAFFPQETGQITFCYAVSEELWVIVVCIYPKKEWIQRI